MDSPRARPGGPWIWSRAVDLGVFLGPTLAAFGLIGASRLAGHEGKLPELGWVVFILGVDVAHVWATLYRTYLDPAEIREHPYLYSLVPLGCWLAGAALHHHSGALFWRVLAYVAVFHFVRQQAGWAAIYRARSGARGLADRLVDDAAIYLGTGVPLLIWHTRLPQPFSWFVEGDFVPLEALGPLVPWARGALALSLVIFAAHHAARARRGEAVPAGKVVVVLTTAVSWYAGIALLGDDLSFTLLNVLPHGVPYFALLWAYGQARARTAPRAPGSWIVARGLAPFLALLLACAFAEETLWDRLIWHDHGWLFGFFPEGDGGAWRDLLIPLLALPQATHYVLDAVLWRRGTTGPEQATALGFSRG